MQLESFEAGQARELREWIQKLQARPYTEEEAEREKRRYILYSEIYG